MGAQGISHDVVKSILIANGWTITNDPLVLEFEVKGRLVDLGAERVLVADKVGRKIAVETKCFSEASNVDDLERAVGRFALVNVALEEREPDRRFYLAIPGKIADEVFQDPVWQLMLKRDRVRLAVLDADAKVVASWMPQ